MELGTILSLIKLGLEIFKDERKGRFTKKYVKLEREYMDEMSKPENIRSDLALDRLYFDAGELAKLIVTESSK